MVHNDLLNSWKEIAKYLGRGVRTVQRWETELHLPVRRPYLHRRSAVTALKSEVDQWVRNGRRSTNGAHVSLPGIKETTATLKLNRQTMRTLSTQLRDQMQRTRGLLEQALASASKSGTKGRASGQDVSNMH